ncbi:hypothetical protein [Streptomyces sp. KS 21]|uniref:hypothetical protein n=1 Tax=Streptomyces sp. KS 21 TaxID=2485150 RepID=UPI00106451D5|nr:hypothetical protein [Streptomyces sp. KS 21]
MTQEDPVQAPSPATRRARLSAKVKRWWERQSIGVKGLIFSVVGGVAVFAVTNGLVPGVAALVRWLTGSEQHGLIITGQEVVPSDRAGWVFEGKAYADLVPAPTQVERENLEAWARENGGTAVSQNFWFTLGGKSGKAVDVTKLVPEVSCGPSIKGVHVYDFLYLSVIPSRSTVLKADGNPPEIEFLDERGKRIKAPKYQVTDKDKQEVGISVHANAHRCTWSVVVEWAVGADEGHTTRIPEKGHYVVTGSNAATEHWKTDGTLTPDYGAVRGSTSALQSRPHVSNGAASSRCGSASAGSGPHGQPSRPRPPCAAAERSDPRIWARADFPWFRPAETVHEPLTAQRAN